MKNLFVLLLLAVSACVQASDIKLGYGVDVRNSLLDEKSSAWMAELHTQYNGQTLIFGYLNEGHKDDNFGKRDGVYAQLMTSHDGTKLSLDTAVGVYLSAATVSTGVGHGYVDRYHLNGIISIAMNYHFQKSKTFGVNFYRTFLTHNNDADIFLGTVTFTLD